MNFPNVIHILSPNKIQILPNLVPIVSNIILWKNIRLLLPNKIRILSPNIIRILPNVIRILPNMMQMLPNTIRILSNMIRIVQNVIVKEYDTDSVTKCDTNNTECNCQRIWCGYCHQIWYWFCCQIWYGYYRIYMLVISANILWNFEVLNNNRSWWDLFMCHVLSSHVIFYSL